MLIIQNCLPDNCMSLITVSHFVMKYAETMFSITLWLSPQTSALTLFFKEGEFMSQYIKTIDVAGGMIKATCPRCARTAYLEVAPNSRRRIFRCRCGKSATYNINYRKERREVTYGPARIITRNARQTKIRLNDVSVSGVSFYIGSEFALAMRRGQEIGIKFRSGGSSVMQRKIRIRNINKNRIGAQYVRAGVTW